MELQTELQLLREENALLRSNTKPIKFYSVLEPTYAKYSLLAWGCLRSKRVEMNERDLIRDINASTITSEELIEFNINTRNAIDADRMRIEYTLEQEAAGKTWETKIQDLTDISYLVNIIAEVVIPARAKKLAPVTDEEKESASSLWDAITQFNNLVTRMLLITRNGRFIGGKD